MKNEAQAAEMFRNALGDFEIRKMTKVEVSHPEIARDGKNGVVRVKLRVSPDSARWKQFREYIRPILAHVATHHASFENWMPMDHEVGGNGLLVGLFAGTNSKGSRWDVFRVPMSLDGPLARLAERRYCLKYALITETGNTVVQTNHPVSEGVLNMAAGIAYTRGANGTRTGIPQHGDQNGEIR